MADDYSSGVGGGGGNDWELVSLTASTYAAAPGPALPLLPHDKTEFRPAAAAPAIFMSQHFNLPAAQALCAGLNGGREQQLTPAAMVDDLNDGLSMPCPQNDRETEIQGDNGLTRGSDIHKRLPSTLGLDDCNAMLQEEGQERQATMVCSPAPPLFPTTTDAAGSDIGTSSAHVSAAATDGIITSDSATLTTAHVVPVAGDAACVATNRKGPSSSSKTPPREGHAWWNRTFSFLRSNSKESLTFRFTFVAATVVGQRDRLQLRLEFNVDSEKISCAVREPIGQVKLNMLVGGSPVGVTN